MLPRLILGSQSKGLAVSLLYLLIAIVIAIVLIGAVSGHFH
jgi:hypothetical protein